MTQAAHIPHLNWGTVGWPVAVIAMSFKSEIIVLCGRTLVLHRLRGEMYVLVFSLLGFAVESKLAENPGNCLRNVLFLAGSSVLPAPPGPGGTS